jgi:OsmC subfamily peroxiredoxin
VSIRLTRTARASWSGTMPEGGGRLALGSGAFEEPFTLKARVEEGQPGANPEELIGAGHAGCFMMSLADLLSSEGHPPADLRTTANVRLEQLAEGFRITRIDLQTEGEVPGVDEARFSELAERAKSTCHTLFPRVYERRNQLAGTLSGGEQQMVALGRALMSRPRMLLMDEPSMGLAPTLVQQNFQIIKQVHDDGVAILMVEQNAAMALSIADRGYVLATGEIVLAGSAQSLLASEDLKRAYLGR